MRRMRNDMRRSEIKQGLLESVHFLFPSVCMVCRRVLVEEKNCGAKMLDLQICSSCLSSFPVRVTSERWFPCLSDPYEGDPVPDLPVWALFHYDVPITILLRQMKFHSRKYCGVLVGELMGREFPSDIPFQWDAVIPLPLSERRMEERGFNQAEVLAKGLSEHLGIPLCNNVIRKVKHTKQQSRFTEPSQRAENVKGAFAVNEKWDISGWNILLVDDILTTGATMHEAAKVLLESGACRVIGAVAATHRENTEN